MKKLNLNWYLLFEVFFLEFTLHYICFHNFEISSMLFFVAAIALLTGGFCQCFSKKIINKSIFYAFSGVITVLYISQIIYLKG